MQAISIPRRNGTRSATKQALKSRTSSPIAATSGTSAGRTREPASPHAVEIRPKRRSTSSAAKAVLDRGTNPAQQPFFPYLTGYVALYTGDAKTAVEDLQKASVQRRLHPGNLLGQAHEKLGDKQQAHEWYAKAAAVLKSHNPPGAYSIPFAKKKLAAAQ